MKSGQWGIEAPRSTHSFYQRISVLPVGQSCSKCGGSGRLGGSILTFGSGHDLTVCEFEPHVRLCADGIQPAWDSHSLLLSLPLPCSLSLSFSLSLTINKLKQKFKKAECGGSSGIRDKHNPYSWEAPSLTGETSSKQISVQVIG